jgi:hypothetical protein
MYNMYVHLEIYREFHFRQLYRDVSECCFVTFLCMHSEGYSIFNKNYKHVPFYNMFHALRDLGLLVFG